MIDLDADTHKNTDLKIQRKNHEEISNDNRRC